MYKFGDGLSYNTFNYSMASTNAQTVLKGAVVDTIGDKYHNDLIAAKQSDTLVEIPITVQNLGPFSSAAEVVLVYVHPPKDALEQGLPIKSLRWFERVRFTTLAMLQSYILP